MVCHVSVAFFFVLFSLKKSFVKGRGGRFNRFSNLKTGVVRPLIALVL